MQVIHSVLALVVTLGILITFHEFGHYWVARRCGVKVLRFSIGFGKALFKWRNKEGTEFVIALLPLGGYVKMLDEREAPVPAHLADQSFNSKSVGQRFAIVAAGPLANFLLAILVYWFIFIWGSQVHAPIIGEVKNDTPAAQAGLSREDEILSINQRATPSWQAVSIELLNQLGNSSTLEIEYRSNALTNSGSHSRTTSLELNNFLAGVKEPDPLAALGLTPWQPKLEARLGGILAGSPAEAAGLQTGDLITHLDNQPIDNWHQMVQLLQANPLVDIPARVIRANQSLEVILTPQLKHLDDGRQVGFIGAGVEVPPWPEELLREEKYNPISAIPQALAKTYTMTELTIKSIGKMLTGLISPSNLSGPITIARVASDTAKSGLESFLSFLAYVSISLGILNLLPIPVLDGGHLAFYTYEAIRGKPMSEALQMQATKIGLALLLSLMVLAFYFDLMRL